MQCWPRIAAPVGTGTGPGAGATATAAECAVLSSLDAFRP